MEKSKKPVCYTPSSEPFRIYLSTYLRKTQIHHPQFDNSSWLYHRFSRLSTSSWCHLYWSIICFWLVPHTLLLHKLLALELPGRYVNWFRSYLTNRQSQGRVSGTIFFPFQVLLDVPHGPVLGLLLFRVYTKDFRDIIKHSRYLLFADDIKNIPSH
jgi:hypothetical protein